MAPNFVFAQSTSLRASFDHGRPAASCVHGYLEVTIDYPVAVGVFAEIDGAGFYVLGWQFHSRTKASNDSLWRSRLNSCRRGRRLSSLIDESNRPSAPFWCGWLFRCARQSGIRYNWIGF